MPAKTQAREDGRKRHILIRQSIHKDQNLISRKELQKINI